MFHRLVLTKCKALFFLFILFIFPFSVNAIVKPTNDFYVNDYAKILTEQTKEYLMKKSITLQENSGIQIVVTTVKNLEGKSIEDYSLEFARSAGIGNKNENNGILILIAYQERNLRIEVGYGLEGIITDGKAGRIRDNYMVPYLKKNDWNNGVKNGYDAIYQEIVKDLFVNSTLSDQAELKKMGTTKRSVKRYIKKNVDDKFPLGMTFEDWKRESI